MTAGCALSERTSMGVLAIMHSACVVNIKPARSMAATYYPCCRDDSARFQLFNGGSAAAVEPDMEFGVFKALFGPENTGYEDKALVQLKLGAHTTPGISVLRLCCLECVPLDGVQPLRGYICHMCICKPEPALQVIVLGQARIMSFAIAT